MAFQNRKPLRLENLEDRHMLAGNVLASLNNGVLTITGDNHDNYAQVTQTGGTGEITVNGFPDNSGAPTTINGLHHSFTFSGVRSVRMNMMGGDDVAEVFGSPNQQAPPTTIRGFLIVNGNAGNDAIIVDNVHLKGRTILRGQAGDDALRITETVANRDVTISGQANRDQLVLFDSKFRSTVSLDGGSQNDEIFIGAAWSNTPGCEFRSDFYAYGGQHQDRIQVFQSKVLGTSLILGDSGVDRIDAIKTQFRGSAFFDGGMGSDLINLEESRFFGYDLNVQGNNGKDGIRLARNYIKSTETHINGGAANDEAMIIDSAFATFGSILNMDGGLGKNDEIIFGHTMQNKNGNYFRSDVVFDNWENVL